MTHFAACLFSRPTVQWGELNAAKEKYPERAAKLLAAFEKIDPRMDPTASAVFDVSNWDQSSWSAEDGVVEQMLQRLTQLDAEEGKKHRDPKNRIRDVLIGHTAIKNKATLISDDPRLRRLVSEFGGRAISTSDIRQGYARARWKVGLFRVWIVGSICWAVYFLWSDAAEVEDWTCWRRLLGIDEGPRCAVDTKGLIEALSELFGPPLVAGIALLAIVWIVTGVPATCTSNTSARRKNGVFEGCP